MVGTNVSGVVLNFLNGGEVSNNFNHTNVVLIPRVPNPSKIGNFFPISLCNVLDKLAMKVITNKPKNVPPRIISPTQSAFTLSRLITENILVSYEVFIECS